MSVRLLESRGVLAVLGCCLLATSQASAQEGRITKYARFQAGDVVAYGVVQGDRIRQIDGDPLRTWRPTNTTFALSEVKLLVPCQPTKVLAVGLNYKSHLRDRPVPKMPEIFYKPLSCLTATGTDIVIPGGTQDVHYEGELVIVMARQAKDVSVAEAPKYVLGVTCGNDVSARDWQKNDLQWWRAKGADTFGPCGPYIVSGLNYNDLLLQVRLNGELKQRERTSDLLYPVAEIVSSTSRYVTLEPGDLIYTGTPGSTSAIKPGDIVEVEIEGIGVLKNTVAAARKTSLSRGDR